MVGTEAETDKELHADQVKWLTVQIGNKFEFDNEHEHDANLLGILTSKLSMMIRKVETFPIDVIKEALENSWLHGLEAGADEFAIDGGQEEKDYAYKEIARMVVIMRLLHDDYYVHWARKKDVVPAKDGKKPKHKKGSKHTWQCPKCGSVIDFKQGDGKH